MGLRKDNDLESVKIESKKKTQKIDRVVLDVQSITAVQSLQQQVYEQLGDLVQISLKDVVNFILQERSNLLTEDELNKLKSKHFDIVKALRKAASEAIKAKQNGSELQLDEVLKIIQTPGVIQNAPSRKLRGRKPKTNANGATSNKNESAKGNYIAVNSSKNSDTKETNSDTKIENSQAFTNQKSS